MVSGHDEDSQLARALAGGKPHPTGWFRLYFEDERWEWSPEVERLHGYEPGTAKPTTSMVLSHKHPEDYEQVAATLDDIRRTHQPFSTRHRIIDVQGRIHEVIVVAELLRDAGGEVIGTDGFYVDVTFPPEERESFISDAVAEIAANRAVIEQVKGILMIVYRIDADAVRPPQMAVAGSQHQAAGAGRTAPGRFSGTQLRRHPAPTPSVRPTTANRPQPCPAVMCDRETVDADTVGESGPWTATIVKERHMIEYNLDTEHSILHVQPKSAIEQDDFVKLAKAVDPHIEATGGLAGLIIETPSFPGWKSFGAMVNQFRFVRDHHKRIKRIGVVTDSHLGDVAEHLTSHFVSAEIRHFPAGQIEAARQWIMNGS